MTDHTETRLKHLEDLRSLVEASTRLNEVFTADWFDEVKALIVEARGEPRLKLETHTAFIGYLHDACWIRNGTTSSRRWMKRWT